MSTTTITVLAEERIRLKDELNALTERLAQLDAVLIEKMDADGITKAETVLGNVALVKASTTSWNEEVLKGLLTPAQWKRITVSKVDKSRLDAELLVGRISKDDVSVAQVIKPSKPYLKNV